MHAGKLRQVTIFTIVGGTAKHYVDQYMVFISLLFAKGRHSYAGWATCWALPRISSLIYIYTEV